MFVRTEWFNRHYLSVLKSEPGSKTSSPNSLRGSPPPTRKRVPPGMIVLAPLERGYLIIEGPHVLIIVPLLVAKPSVDCIVRCLEGVLDIGLTLLEGGLQSILDHDLTLPQYRLHSIDTLLDNSLEGFDHGWVHFCHCSRERETGGPGISFTGLHSGHQMFLPDTSHSRLHKMKSVVASHQSRTKWGFTCRRLSDAQVSKSVKKGVLNI